MVLNTRGEVLFARALVFFEGDTEEGALPIFAESFFLTHPINLGISMIGVGGSGSYSPFIRLANSLDIPWFIFSDGEVDTVKSVMSALKSIGEGSGTSNVIFLPEGLNFETYLASLDYKDAIISGIIAANAQNDQHRKALEKEWSAKTDPLKEIASELGREKARLGPIVARHICAMSDKGKSIPVKLRELFEAISQQLSPGGVSEGKKSGGGQ
jgi:putative ATP-dependent endonuclease of OLD family